MSACCEDTARPVGSSAQPVRLLLAESRKTERETYGQEPARNDELSVYDVHTIL